MDLGQRICLFGGPGSGKSTLARLLGQALGLPVVHLDSLFWKPGWVESTPEEIAAKVREAALTDTWVIDGNYNMYSRDLRLERASAVIVLDMPRITRMAGVVARTLTRKGRSRADLAPGCPQRFTWAFTRLAWQWDSQYSIAGNIAAAQAQGVPCIVLHSRRAVNRLVRETAKK